VRNKKPRITPINKQTMHDRILALEFEMGKVSGAIVQMANVINSQGKVMQQILTGGQNHVQGDGNPENTSKLPIQPEEARNTEDSSGSGEQGLLPESSDSTPEESKPLDIKPEASDSDDNTSNPDDGAGV